jgi:hypothetical protein
MVFAKRQATTRTYNQFLCFMALKAFFAQKPDCWGAPYAVLSTHILMTELDRCCHTQLLVAQRLRTSKLVTAEHLEPVTADETTSGARHIILRWPRFFGFRTLREKAYNLCLSHLVSRARTEPFCPARNWL